MKRSLAVVVLPLVLGGCLPLPISIASTAFSGISYLTSGKSTTDHVLSATMDQDCALTRPVFGEPVCRDVGPDGEGRTPAVTVAYYPGDRDDGITDEERLAFRSRGALELDDLNDDARQVALAARYIAPPPPRVSVAGIVVAKDQLVPAPSTRALPVAADTSWRTLVPPRTIDVAPLAAPVPIVAAPSPVAPVAAVSSPAVSPSPSRVAAVAPSARSVEAPPQATAAADADRWADRWVVLGSFRDVERARVMAARYAGRAPRILEAEVRGGQWHRVALGPMTPGQAKRTKAGLGRVDGRTPWVVRLAAD